ncbi:MAG: chemotaxis protein CheA [Gammaproteobacteria bacterium]|nr:chemotaxis protein CheA [Gammaproteobacteria bacterium]MDH5651426.1 chemotaxis protein CheA [Gammaproteobacteria bacterium]
MSDKAVNSFDIEAKELLAIMEESLLELEKDPENTDLVNAIFRSAHTIKGTGGVFGFDNIVEFTHVVENLLDKVRAGEIQVESDMIALLLACSDQMNVLVQLAVDGIVDLDEKTRGNGAELKSRLNEYLGGNNSNSVSQSDVNNMLDMTVKKLEENMVADNWHISIKFDKEVLQNGMDPISFLRYLKKLGDEISVTTLYDGLPALNDTDAELCYLAFEVNFFGEVEKKQIESVFEFVKEMCSLHITPPKKKIDMFIEMMDQLPDEEMRLGEILVATGALTQQELDDALSTQAVLGAGDGRKLGEVLVKEHVVHQETVDAALNKQAQLAEKVRNQNRVLRVDAEKLDGLINLVGELVIAGASSNLLAHQLGDERLLESMSTMARLVEEIRDSALTLRMVQIGETFTRFQRVVRDVSKELGKDIKLEINGAETELDKTVVEKIGDPLMHLVRNAMDHGIESAKARSAAGKPTQGVLQLNAFHDSGSIVIEVKDDGGGLSKERILAKAQERGMNVDEDTMTDREIYRLIFEAGFSTADKVTNLSGRGVGMDVVKRNIESLRGTVDVSSTPGKGTTVSIRLPLTLAIIDGFLVGVGESSYVIPLDMIQECIELNEDEQKEIAVQSYINLRGEVLPFLRLREFFKDNAREKHRENIVVVQFGNQKAGFVVDELLGEFQTVIKPMSKILQKLKGISGATILGSGDVAVILDVPTLVQRATHHASANHSRKSGSVNSQVLH